MRIAQHKQLASESQTCRCSNGGGRALRPSFPLLLLKFLDLSMTDTNQVRAKFSISYTNMEKVITIRGFNMQMAVYFCIPP